MFGTMLNETLGKITFWIVLNWFPFNILYSTFLRFMGMPRRVFTFLDNQGLNTGNMISTVGALFMAFGVIVLVINIIITSVKNVKVGNDPWGDGRTLEWAIPSPPPFYNFKQLPLVRGLDAYWVEKMEGKKEMTPAEPLGDIHMPNSSIFPLTIAFGLFVAAFGALYNMDR